LLDFNDPHNVTDVGFLEEIIEYIYSVYINMTPTPLSEEDFRILIVPNISFIELMKRAFLNKWLYLKIRNIDGSIPQEFTIKLSEDWSFNTDPNEEVTYTFPIALTDEISFIRSGWNNVTTPRATVFNALDLTSEFDRYDTVFHTCVSSPYETVTGSAFGYPVTITGSSNDFMIKVSTNKAPSQTTTLISLLNVNNTLTVRMTSTSAITVMLETTTIFNNVICNDCKFILTVNKNGLFQLITSNNGAYTTTSNTINLTSVGILTTALIGIPLMNNFDGSFGAKEISVVKPFATVGETPSILPLIFYTPQSTTVPLQNTVSVSGTSQVFFPQLGYKVYLTLSGTWIGTVSLQISRDGGSSWGSFTSGGEVIGFYSGNCDEAVTNVIDPLVRFRLVYSVTSGTLSYRLAQ